MIDLNLKDKVVIVIGGAGLLGSEFVKNLLEHQCKVIVADIVPGKEPANSAQFINVDITSEASISDLIKKVTSLYKKIDAVVNCAYPRTKSWGTKFEHVKYDDFCANVNMHLGGYFLVAQQFALYFKGQGHGNIINFSSIYGHVAPRFEIYEGTEMTLPIEYSVIKAGVEHLTRYMTKYFKNCGVRFNTISPGGILDSQPEPFKKKYREYSCNKGMLDKTDIVGTVLFLLSDLSLYINGQNLVVSDGWH